MEHRYRIIFTLYFKAAQYPAKLLISLLKYRQNEDVGKLCTPCIHRLLTVLTLQLLVPLALPTSPSRCADYCVCAPRTRSYSSSCRHLVGKHPEYLHFDLSLSDAFWNCQWCTYFGSPLWYRTSNRTPNSTNSLTAKHVLTVVVTGCLTLATPLSFPCSPPLWLFVQFYIHATSYFWLLNISLLMSVRVTLVLMMQIVTHLMDACERQLLPSYAKQPYFLDMSPRVTPFTPLTALQRSSPPLVTSDLSFALFSLTPVRTNPPPAPPLSSPSSPMKTPVP